MRLLHVKFASSRTRCTIPIPLEREFRSNAVQNSPSAEGEFRSKCDFNLVEIIQRFIYYFSVKNDDIFVLK